MPSKNKPPKFTTLDAVVKAEKETPPMKPETYEDLLKRTVVSIFDKILTQGVGSLETDIDAAMKDAISWQQEETAYEVYTAKKTKKKSPTKKAKAKVKKTVKKTVKKNKKK